MSINERAELVKAALLGTQRYDLAAPDPDSALGKLYAQLDAAEPPHRLLSVAGAYFLRQAAGEQPNRVSTPRTLWQNSTAEPASELTACSTLASQNLAAILWGYAPDLLGEFLKALAKHNQRIPEQYLPTVLGRGEKSVPIRSIILPVLGPSGRWLAAQNPLWGYATEAAATWDGAIEMLKQLPTTKRQGFLRQLRGSHPTLMREILSNQWKSITTSDRASYIKIVDNSLGSEDEDFLELALDDRNNVVRRKAAELLAKLPDSKLCKRMTENAEGFLTWTPEKDIGITVLFPAEITPQLVRDGVMIRKLRDESRVRAYQMKEIIGAIPLAHWTLKWQVTPEKIVAAARTSRWPRTLKQSFAVAAERQKNVEWAKVLLADDEYKVSTLKLINLLPIEECEAIVKDSCAAEFEPLTKSTLIVQILRKRLDPWPETLATLWFDQLVQHLEYDLAHRKLVDEQSAASLAADAKKAVDKKDADKKAADKNDAGKKSGDKGVKSGMIAASKETIESIEYAKSIDPILRLLIRQSGRCAPVSMTQHIVEKLTPFVQEFSIWRPVLQELISTIKFRQTMLENISKG